MKAQRGEILAERYCLWQRLGAHGNRQTWLAFDTKTGEPVVLKTLRFAPGEQVWQEVRLAEREAETLASLSFPGVPQFRESFELSEPEGVYFCLILDYIPGKSLAFRVREEGPLDVEEAKELATAVLVILQKLHALAPPVVHRDLKPDNLILREGDKRVCLVDFGSVRATNGEGRTATVVGTYGYMAPEQFAGVSEPSTDLYGLGVTVLFALTGQDPADWPRRGMRLDLGGPTIPDEGLRNWLVRMLDPDPTRRFANAAQALLALRQPDVTGSELALPQLNGGSLRVTLSADRRRVELTSTDLWKNLGSAALPAIGAFGLVGGLYCLEEYGLTNPRLYLSAIMILMVVWGGLMLAVGLRDLHWEWHIVFDGKQRRLLRILFGKVFECQELPASVQVAIGHGDRGCSISLVTPDAKQHLLGSWYSKAEAEHLAQFLRQWLMETE